MAAILERLRSFQIGTSFTNRGGHPESPREGQLRQDAAEQSDICFVVLDQEDDRSYRLHLDSMVHGQPQEPKENFPEKPLSKIPVIFRDAK